MPTPSPADQYWELTTSTITHGGETLHRLRATRAIPEQGVAAGTLGGWVSPQAQLSDAAWVADSAKVLGSVVVTRHALVCGRAEVRDKAQVSGPVIISDDAVVSDSVTIDADKGATVSGRAHMSDHATLFEQAQISGRATISDDALLSGQSMVSEQAHVGDSAVIIDHANITLPQHILTVAPLGPAHASATLFRTDDGHCLVIGSWHGTVDQLAEYGMNPQELQGLTTIAAARIKAWSP